MCPEQTEAKSFLAAFRRLSKSQRTAVIEHLVRDREFGIDLEDAVLIERARQEKGEDIPLNEYVRSRKE